MSPLAELGPDEEYLSCWSIGDDDHPLSIESAKRMSHDSVILAAGADRRSGVMWTFWRTDNAPVLLGDDPDGGIPLPADVALLCELALGRPLVMATVKVRKL